MFKESLYQWADEVLIPTAQIAYKGEGEYQCGDWCKFCRAQNECRARAEAHIELARHEFKLPPLLEDDEIESVLGKLNDLVAWANSLKEYALQSALAGKVWNGYKVVEGRSNRRYVNDEKVAEAAKKAVFRDIYRQSLITLTDMERLMGKEKFKKVLNGLIEKPAGKPALVPELDKRQPST